MTFLRGDYDDHVLLIVFFISEMKSMYKSSIFLSDDWSLIERHFRPERFPEEGVAGSSRAEVG
jgi:hypothetical protein